MRNHPELKDKLWENVNALQSGLRRNLILEILILALRQFILEVSEAMIMVNDLRENYGIFLSIVIYPVIPKELFIV
jgi:glycine C-acetyltransferase